MASNAAALVMGIRSTDHHASALAVAAGSPMAGWCPGWRRPISLLLFPGHLHAFPARLAHGGRDGLVLGHALLIDMVLDLLVDELARFLAVAFFLLGHGVRSRGGGQMGCGQNAF